MLQHVRNALDAKDLIDAFAQLDPKLKEDLDRHYTEHPSALPPPNVFRKWSILSSGLNYYKMATDAGYSKLTSITGAISASTIKLGADFFGIELLVVSSGEFIASGIATAILVVTVPPAALISGTVMGISAWGMKLGWEAIKNSDELAQNVLFATCELLEGNKHGFTFVIPGKKGLGFFRKDKNTIHNDQLAYVFMGDVLKGDQADIKFYQDILNEGTVIREGFPASWQQDFANDFETQLETKRFIEEELGLIYDQIPETARDFISYPEQAVFSYFPGEGLRYDLSLPDPSNTLGIADGAATEAKRLIYSHMAKNGGLIDENGQFAPSVLQNLTGQAGNPAVPTDYISSKLFTAEIKAIKAQLKQLFKLNEAHSKKLDTIFTKGFMVPLSDGTSIPGLEIMAGLHEHLEDLKKKEQTARENAAKYYPLEELKRSHTNAKNFTSAFVLAGSIVGSQDMQRYGSAVGGCFDMGFALAAMIIAPATIPQMAVTFLTGLSSVIGAFRKKETIDPFQVVFEQLKVIVQLQEDIKYLVIAGNIKLDNKLDVIIQQVSRGFGMTLMAIYVSRLMVVRKLDHIQTSIYQLSIQLNKQISGLWLESLKEALFTIENHQLKYGDLSRLKSKEYSKIVHSLVHWLIKKSADDNSTGAHLYYPDCEVKHVLAVIRHADVNDIAGFLMLYAQEKLNVVLEGNDFVVCNPNVWLMALQGYLNVLTPKYFHELDPHYAEYEAILASGIKIVNFYKALQSSYQLFPVLFLGYRKTLLSVARALEGLVSNHNDSTISNTINKSLVAGNEQLQMLRLDPQQKFNCSTQHLVSVFRDHTHENVSVGWRLNQWQQQVANDATGVFPALISEYFELLQQDYAELEAKSLSYDRSLVLYAQGNTAYGYLLPTSILFKGANQEKLSNDLDKLDILLRAEKFSLGHFIFAIKEERKADKMGFAVTVSFNYQSKPFDVAVIHLLAKTPHSAVLTIQSLANIDSKYGAEIGNKYIAITEKTLARAEYLSAWLRAEIVSVENLYRTQPTLESAVDERRAIGGQAVMLRLQEDLGQGISRPWEASKSYEKDFLELSGALIEHELNYQLLQVFGRLIGLPDSAMAHINKLWDKNHILELIKDLASSQATSACSFLHTVEQHFGNPVNAASSSTLSQPKKTDLDEKKAPVPARQADWRSRSSTVQPKEQKRGNSGDLQGQSAPRLASQHALILPDAEEAVRSVTGSFSYRCRAELQAVVEGGLITLIEQAQKLSIKLDTKLIAQVAWYSTLANYQSAESYSAEEIETLLSFNLQNNKNVIIIPSYYPLQDFPEFLEQQFLTQWEQACKTCLQKGTFVLIPLLFEQSIGEPPIQQELWVLLAITRDKEGLSIVYIDPTGNGTVEQETKPFDLGKLKLSAPLAKQDARFYAFVRLIQQVLQSATIRLSLFVTGLCQISEEEWPDSGPLLVQNAIDWVEGKELAIHDIQKIRQLQSEDLLRGGDIGLIAGVALDDKVEAIPEKAVRQSDEFQEFLNIGPRCNIHGLGLLPSGYIVAQCNKVYKALDPLSGKCGHELDMYAATKDTFEIQDVVVDGGSHTKNQFAILKDGQVMVKFPVKIARGPYERNPTYETILTLWNPVTGRHGQFIRAPYQITQLITLASDGRVVSGSFDPDERGGELRTWDPATGRSLQIKMPFNNACITALGILQDGCLIAAAGRGVAWDPRKQQNSVLLVSDENFKEVKIVVNHLDWITALLVLENGQVVTASCNSNHPSRPTTVKVWDPINWQFEHSFEIGDGTVYAFEALSNEHIITVEGSDTCIWNLKTGFCEQRMTNNNNYRSMSLLALPDAQVASGDWDGAIRIRQVQQLKLPQDAHLKSRSDFSSQKEASHSRNPQGFHAKQAPSKLPPHRADINKGKEKEKELPRFT
jgi:hypothetical protein